MKLDIVHSQKQVMSYRMQLSASILQMNTFDLEQFIRDSAVENPLIELEMPQETESYNADNLKKLEWLDSIDRSNSYQYTYKPEDEDRDTPLYEKNEPVSLADILLAQLIDLKLEPGTENRVRYLIENLDDNGYTTIPREQLCQDLSIDDTKLERALEVLHQMDPPGVGAYSLRECLLIQAKMKPCASPALVPLIESCLDMLTKNNLAKIAKVLKVSIDEAKLARCQLLELNPKPGNGYSSYKSIPYIRPDIFIVRFKNNFQIILNDSSQPKFTINSYYRELAKNENTETASYIREKLGKAEWLQLCILRRKKTVLKCAASLLRRQAFFFDKGPGNLVPMTLADVSADLDVHPSTVSRAIRGKYIQCQWGVFGMASFFSRGVGQATSCEDKSQDMILALIKRVVSEENPLKPRSDQEITNLLQQHGIDIARRTVSKYREQIGLPPACGRKKY